MISLVQPHFDIKVCGYAVPLRDYTFLSSWKNPSGLHNSINDTGSCIYRPSMNQSPSATTGALSRETRERTSERTHQRYVRGHCWLSWSHLVSNPFDKTVRNTIEKQLQQTAWKKNFSPFMPKQHRGEMAKKLLPSPLYCLVLPRSNERVSHIQTLRTPTPVRPSVHRTRLGHCRIALCLYNHPVSSLCWAVVTGKTHSYTLEWEEN